jgi:hypothetical protein
MTVRGVHFVGSYPAPNAREAMRAMIDGAHREIDCVPDGETGGRAPGVTDELLALRDEHTAIVVERPGDYGMIERFPRLGVRPGREPEFTWKSLATLRAFDYVGQARQARAVLSGLADEIERPLTLQLCLPHALDLAFLAFSPGCDPRAPEPPYLRVFAEHLQRQIHATVAAIGADQVLFQIESRCALRRHLGGAATGPQDAVVGETLPQVINRSTPQARFGIHLCLGDIEDQAAVPRLRSATPIVSAIAEIADALERPEALEYVHFPLAAGTSPPPVEREVYRPLARVREILPPDTRIIAGLVNEHQSLRDQLHVRDLVEDAVGEPVNIAAACGLGRRAPEVAQLLVARMVELASG